MNSVPTSGMVARKGQNEPALGEPLMLVRSAGNLLRWLQRAIVAPLIPRLSVVSDVSGHAIGLIVPAYKVPYGLLSDRLGRRCIMVASRVAFVVLTRLTATARSTSQMILWRLTTGLGVSRVVPLALLTVFLLGCAMGPDYKRPPIVTPVEWRSPAEGVGSLADLGWWQLFKDSVLQELIRTALEQNKDLRLAVARVVEVQAQFGITRASQFPQVTGQASYTNERLSEKTFPEKVLHRRLGVAPQQDFYRTDLDLTFEIDLWGRLRRATEAARADLLASVENQRMVVTTLVSNVAQAYFDLLELDRETEIDRRTLQSRRASLDLVRQRFEAGLASKLDVRRAEGELATAAATVPDAERRVAQTEQRLSMLLGRNPGTIPRGTVLEAQTPLSAVPAGLPSALLERRPDIRQAEERLVAVTAQIGEAKAAFFPQISLTGQFGAASVALSDLFTGPARVWQAGPAITLPIFTAGRLRGNLRATQAREQQALIQYEQTIQQAFREVEDALVFHRKARDTWAQRELRVTAARQALELAGLRYTNGRTGYLDVLDAERQLYAAEIDLASTTRDQLTAVVQIYKALGGGWEAEPVLGEPAR